MTFLESLLHSKKVRSIVRINLGFTLFRNHLFGFQLPKDTSIHYFDYLLYKRTERKKSLNDFYEWLDTRELT